MRMFYVKYNLQNSSSTWAVLYSTATQKRVFFISLFGYLQNTNMIQLKLSKRHFAVKSTNYDKIALHKTLMFNKKNMWNQKPIKCNRKNINLSNSVCRNFVWLTHTISIKIK
jgi:hypothetical protein